MRVLLASLVLMLSLATLPASACFGPKLYLGVGEGEKSEILQALVILYVKEKTGTEIVPVPLEGRDPLEEIAWERIDMALLDGEDAGATTVLLRGVGNILLVSGPRPLNDLQFTTVPPALSKLDGLLEPDDFEALLRRSQASPSPTAAAREFLMERGWI